MRLVFLGAPPFATPVFEALLQCRHDVALLVTPPDRKSGRGRRVKASALVELAHEHGCELYQPPNSKVADFVPTIRAAEADLLIVASYGEILRADFLELATALNVHASLLPRWRGASPIQAAIRAGDRITGVSIQRMVLALDAGDVMLSKELEIGARETAGELLQRLALLGGQAIVEAIDALERDDVHWTPQDPELVTHAKKLTKEDGVIDWTQPADVVERMIRSVTPWPGARTFLPSGKALTVERALVRSDVEVDAGAVADGKAFVVGCANGALELEHVRPAGKATMEGAAFLRGARLAAGTRLGS